MPSLATVLSEARRVTREEKTESCLFVHLTQEGKTKQRSLQSVNLSSLSNSVYRFKLGLICSATSESFLNYILLIFLPLNVLEYWIAKAASKFTNHNGIYLWQLGFLKKRKHQVCKRILHISLKHLSRVFSKSTWIRLTLSQFCSMCHLLTKDATPSPSALTGLTTERAIIDIRAEVVRSSEATIVNIINGWSPAPRADKFEKPSRTTLLITRTTNPFSTRALSGRSRKNVCCDENHKSDDSESSMHCSWLLWCLVYWVETGLVQAE